MKSEVKIVRIKDFDFAKVRYYTLEFEDDSQEVKKFFDKYQEEYSKSVSYIKMWIAEIGEKYGAEERFFRPEDNAGALPPPSPLLRRLDKEFDKENLSLRLYCIVLSPEIVILVNGGIKESQATRDSPSCWKEFQFVSNIASQLGRLIKQGHLTINGKVLERSESFKLTYTK